MRNCLLLVIWYIALIFLVWYERIGYGHYFFLVTLPILSRWYTRILYFILYDLAMQMAILGIEWPLRPLLFAVNHLGKWGGIGIRLTITVKKG